MPVAVPRNLQPACKNSCIHQQRACIHLLLLWWTLEQATAPAVLRCCSNPVLLSGYLPCASCKPLGMHALHAPPAAGVRLLGPVS